MAGVAKQIIGSFEDIGKDIARETAKVPTDVAGRALESLGTASQKGQKGNQAAAQSAGGPKKNEGGALGQLDQTKDQKAKQAIAREALSQLAGRSKQKEPTVQERLEKEKQEKNEKEQQKAAAAQNMAPIAPVSSKPAPGNLYGIKQKQRTTEAKGFRQD